MIIFVVLVAFSGSEEIVIVDNVGNTRIFSLVTEQFKACIIDPSFLRSRRHLLIFHEGEQSVWFCPVSRLSLCRHESRRVRVLVHFVGMGLLVSHLARLSFKFVSCDVVPIERSTSWATLSASEIAMANSLSAPRTVPVRTMGNWQPNTTASSIFMDQVLDLEHHYETITHFRARNTPLAIHFGFTTQSIFGLFQEAHTAVQEHRKSEKMPRSDVMTIFSWLSEGCQMPGN